ncbi:MAG: DNA translocase FtsK [Firmicutes bacterium]|nr:DNA translocase FtsK [Bacillota bacterium]
MGGSKVKEEPYTEIARERANQPEGRQAEQRIEIIGVLLIVISLLSLSAIFVEDTGFVGEILKRGLDYLFGRRGAIIPAFFAGVTGFYLLRFRQEARLSKHYLALILLFIWAFLMLHFFSGVVFGGDSRARDWEAVMEGGGVVGDFLARQLLKYFGKFGTGIFMLGWIAVATILALERPLLEIFFGFGRKVKIRRRKDLVGPAIAKSAPDNNTAPYKLEVNPFQESAISYEPTGIEPVRYQDSKAANVINFPAKPRHDSQILNTLQNMLRDKDKLKDKEAAPALAEKTVTTDTPIKPSAAQQMASGQYRLPGIDLIGASTPHQKRGNRLLDQSRQLEGTLASFGVSAKVIEVHYGPVITRYDLQPAPGVKVSRIVSLADDLALALAAKGLRMEAPIPGKAAIGIEVPNPEIQIVTFRDLLESKLFWNSGKLSFALGMDIAGELVVADLKKMPHLLVAGATGSGKSVCVNTIIMSILFKAFPNEVKFLMIDPKIVELSMYNGIPHLLAPVVTQAKKAAGALKAVVDEMEKRYQLFAEKRVRDLERYNELLPAGETLPVIIVIIDELADLMMVAPVEVEDSICRLAQMARATGIHLVVATQRPSVDVITGLIKANIPSRIAFAVSSQIDSRTILDSAGAERLLGRGDMLFSPVGSMKPRRVQGSLVTEKEIEAVIRHWKEQGEPTYQEQYVNIATQKDKPVGEEEDDLFWDAVRIVVEYNQASASTLQRRLRIGYTRAARLIDMMEAKGMVGPYEGSKPREIYITARQMEELKKRSLEL